MLLSVKKVFQSLVAFLILFVACMCAATETHAFTLKNASGDFFSAALDLAPYNGPSVTESIGENWGYDYESMSGCLLATKKTVYHTVTNPGAGQGVLNGVDPKFLNPDSRFGKAFYMSDDAGTTLSELAHHGATGSHTIRFDLNLGKANVLDFTDPSIAKAWGYTGGSITDATKAIGPNAIDAGFNVIKVPSLRGSGTNYNVLTDFDNLLTPQMIVPTP